MGGNAKLDKGRISIQGAYLCTALKVVIKFTFVISHGKPKEAFIEETYLIRLTGQEIDSSILYGLKGHSVYLGGHRGGCDIMRA